MAQVPTHDAEAVLLPFSASTFDTPLRPRTLGERELGLSEIRPNGPFFRDGPIVGRKALFLMEQYRKRL